MKKDKNSIEFVVLKYFIRVIKDNGTYMYFRCGVNNKGIIGYILKNKVPRSPDNPFISSSSLEEVAEVLERITREMAAHENKKNMDKYEHVTMAINHLLHFFMESNGVSMDKLCHLGEEIYNLSCNRLFGDTLEDLEKHEEKIEEIPSLGHAKAKIYQDFINGIRSGKISRETSFESFLKKHKNLLKIFDDDSMGQGQILGRAPEDMQPIRNHRDEWITTTRATNNWLDADDLPDDLLF